MAERAAMYALTLHQPWAAAIAHGPKRIENRSWAPPLDLIGQRIAIHAGLQVDDAAVNDLDAIFGVRSQRHHEMYQDIRRFSSVRGAVVAVATLVGVINEHDKTALALLPEDAEEWYFGPIGWCLADVQTLARPVACRGYQRLWRLPSDVEVAVLEQITKGGHVDA